VSTTSELVTTTGGDILHSEDNRRVNERLSDEQWGSDDFPSSDQDRHLLVDSVGGARIGTTGVDGKVRGVDGTWTDESTPVPGGYGALKNTHGPDDTLHLLGAIRGSGTTESWLLAWDGASWLEEYTGFTLDDDDLDHYDPIIDAAGQPHAVVGSYWEAWYVGVRDGDWSNSYLDDKPKGMHVTLDSNDDPWACWYDQDPEYLLVCAH